MASPAVLELDGYAWRPVHAEDADELDRLASRGSNRSLFNLPATAADFVASMGSRGFELPMLCQHGPSSFGAAFVSLRSNRNLNMMVTCFFATPEVAALALALYVRHLFWSTPFHRVHAQIPLVDGGEAYVALLTGAGLREEGVVHGHVMFGGQPHDLAVLGVLREEFEAWCREKESRLAL